MADPTKQSSQNHANSQFSPYQSLDSFQRDSVLRPTSSQSAFNPIADKIHQSVDIVSSRLDQLLLHYKTTDTNFKKLRKEIFSLRAQEEVVNTLKYANTEI